MLNIIRRARADELPSQRARERGIVKICFRTGIFSVSDVKTVLNITMGQCVFGDFSATKSLFTFATPYSKFCCIISRKLAAYDSQSRLAVHVAMDMLVVIDDLSKSSFP